MVVELLVAADSILLSAGFGESGSVEAVTAEDSGSMDRGSTRASSEIGLRQLVSQDFLSM